MKRLAALLAMLVFAGCMQVARETTDEELIRTHPERFVVITLHNTDTMPSARAGSSPRDYGSTMPYAIAPTTRATARELATHYRMKPVREWPIAQLSVHCIVYEMNAGESQSDLLRRLRSDARVESAQPLNSFTTMGQAENGPYNDPYAGLQGSLAAMGVPQAHAWSRGKGVNIAVIDTGVDASHADFAGSHVSVSNFTGQRLRPAAHGTAVTGIIAATGGNRLGIVGVAPEADVHVLAACWSAAANPSQAVCDSFTLAIALANAIELKANIVNLSLGGPSDPLLRRLVEHGLARNMIFVAALPGTGAASGFPSEIPGVVVVDAVGHAHTARDVLLAPGTDVLTLAPPNGYDFVSGSSMAAANVSGGIALLLSHRLKANEVREILAQTAPTGDSINLCVALAGRQAHERCLPTVSRASRSD
ncbi:serine protease [Steroidobacter agaridevorans]|uniref:Serine protease n=1 Tax=Steroidobacter agaridevorans TaxID=2695856 RepID=A0A829YB71_9GAMM|nr:S8 family serine peptidase [Steroidobacter agaridevorans]GFE80490.1 serine protease [Steroidobacter agaridevorans]GFE87546.1 serine protease [Steroidobacter agaridevorans]